MNTSYTPIDMVLKDFGTKNRQLESMTRIPIGHLVARVWRTEEDLGKIDNDDLRHAAFQIWINEGKGKPSPQLMAEGLAKLAFVAAVEVLDQRTGDGVLIYPDWN